MSSAFPSRLVAQSANGSASRYDSGSGDRLVSRALLILVALIAGCASAPSGDFSFALIGDLGYTPAQEPMVDRVFGALNTERLAFVVHDGDLGSPRYGSCTDEHWARRLAQFEGSA